MSQYSARIEIIDFFFYLNNSKIILEIIDEGKFRLNIFLVLKLSFPLYLGREMENYRNSRHWHPEYTVVSSSCFL